MELSKDLIYYTKRLLLARYPSFGEELANANIEYKTDLKCHTAATDGKDIFIDPEYLASLSDDDKIFLIAHELMHIKFRHMFRLAKNGKRKDDELWNYVTDAIINANLKRDGFKVKEGYVDVDEALNYSAEELYDMLFKDKEQKNKGNEENNSSDNGEKSSSDGSSQADKFDYENYDGDDHSLWQEAYEKDQKEQEKTNDSNPMQGETQNKMNNPSIDEKNEFQQNREERKRIAKENFQKAKEEIQRKVSNDNSSNKINFGNVGEDNDTIPWETLLRKEIEKSESVWSNRRSIAENNYAYRLEENELEEDAETEVMIDVSGSVELDMVKAFLRTLKPLLKQSKLKVGCFNEKFWGMVEIKSNKDIDNFSIPEAARGSFAWTEDWDLAVRSFTKKKEINKIVFTDGEPCPGTMPKDDLKGINVIWLVYGNESFNPCCGKVIKISEKQLQKLTSLYVDDSSIKVEFKIRK